jgi:hypothetical protein
MLILPPGREPWGGGEEGQKSGEKVSRIISMDPYIRLFILSFHLLIRKELDINTWFVYTRVS